MAKKGLFENCQTEEGSLKKRETTSDKTGPRMRNTF